MVNHSKILLLDSGDIMTDFETFPCGTPFTDLIVHGLSKTGRMTHDEAIIYHRHAIRLNAFTGS